MDQALLVAQVNSSLLELAAMYPALQPWSQVEISKAIDLLNDVVKAARKDTLS